MKAGRREWVGLAVLALPTLIVTMDLSVLFLAVPKLTQDLQPTSSELLWITDIYGFFIAASLITMGNLGDRIGRRRLLLIGAAGFGAASLVAALSSSAAMLIAARAVLGIAAATLAPSSLALIRNMFADERQRGFAIAVWISCFAAGGAVGPIAGGILLAHFWWGSVFLLNLPPMLLLLATGPVLLPESRDPDPGLLDLASVALSLVSVLSTVFAITRFPEHGVDSVSLVALAFGVVVGVVFVRRQRRLASPLIELRLFRSPVFAVALAALATSVFAIAGSDLFVAQYLQLVHGLDPFTASLWLLPGVLALIAGSLLAPALARLQEPGVIVAAGLAVAAAGLIVLADLRQGSNLLVLVAGTILLGLGVGPVGALGTDIVVAAAPPERAGAASALSETATELGGALGIAILGSVGTWVYRGALAGDGALQGLPSKAIATSRGTLGDAFDAARRLSAEQAANLLDAARSAFTQGLGAAAVSAAGVAAATAVLIMLILRPQRPAPVSSRES